MCVCVCVCLCAFLTTPHEQRAGKDTFLKEFNISEFSFFFSPKPVSMPNLKNPEYPTI